jgi:hypothetical protein
MFCVCDVIVSVFVSFALCCAPSRTCLYFHLILLCVYVLATFEQSFVTQVRALVGLFVVC